MYHSIHKECNAISHSVTHLSCPLGKSAPQYLRPLPIVNNLQYSWLSPGSS